MNLPEHILNAPTPRTRNAWNKATGKGTVAEACSLNDECEQLEREKIIKECAEIATKHKERTLAQAKEALEKGEVLLGHRQLICEVIEHAILAKLKE